MLRWRIATAVVVAPLVLAAIAVGGWALYATVLVVVGVAAYDLSWTLDPLPLPAALGAGFVPVLLSIPYGAEGALAGAILGLPWALAWLWARPETRTLPVVLAVVLMALWVGASMAHVVLIGGGVYGATLILIAVVGPWISDAGGYFSGRFFGRRLIFPVLSPSKTVEGALGGLLVTMLLVGWVSQRFLGFPLWEAAVMGAVVSIASQSGDLFGSALKRILEVKDLGNTLPGHGGLLDRIDSLLFTAPAVYYVSLFL